MTKPKNVIILNQSLVGLLVDNKFCNLLSMFSPTKHGDFFLERLQNEL